jgi:uncharacterized protein (DUF427 family)
MRFLFLSEKGNREMKTIGNTHDGNHIVELSRDEYNALSRLISAHGKYEGVMMDNVYYDVDIKNWVHAVWVYTTSKERISEIKELVGALEKKVTGGG